MYNIQYIVCVVFGGMIIISTSTIALQEQLMGDIKSMAEKIGHSIEIVLAKGQSD